MKKKKTTKRARAKKTLKKKAFKIKTTKKLVKKTAKKKVVKKSLKPNPAKSVVKASKPKKTFENKLETALGHKLPNDAVYESIMSTFTEEMRKTYEGKPIPYAEGTVLHPNGNITED